MVNFSQKYAASFVIYYIYYCICFSIGNKDKFRQNEIINIIGYGFFYSIIFLIIIGLFLTIKGKFQKQKTLFSFLSGFLFIIYSLGLSFVIGVISVIMLR